MSFKMAKQLLHPLKNICVPCLTPLLNPSWSISLLSCMALSRLSLSLLIDIYAVFSSIVFAFESSLLGFIVYLSWISFVRSFMIRVFATLLNFRVSLPLRVIGSLLCNFFNENYHYPLLVGAC